jgi:hypothetical protein
MKASLFVVVLLLAVAVNGVRAEPVGPSSLSLSESAATAYWPSAAVVNVYFVHDAFTSEEKHTLWEAIEAWTAAARKAGSAIKFTDAGETGGLIDCADCLTITRQGFDINRFKQRVSFNALRQDAAGRLISAWIGFERKPASPQALKILMQQALEQGLALGVAQSRMPGRS